VGHKLNKHSKKHKVIFLKIFFQVHRIFLLALNGKNKIKIIIP